GNDAVAAHVQHHTRLTNRSTQEIRVLAAVVVAAVVGIGVVAIVAFFARLQLAVATRDRAHARLAFGGAVIEGLEFAEPRAPIVPHHRVVAHDVPVVALLVFLFDAVAAVLREGANRVWRRRAHVTLFELARRRAAIVVSVIAVVARLGAGDAVVTTSVQTDTRLARLEAPVVQVLHAEVVTAVVRLEVAVVTLFTGFEHAVAARDRAHAREAVGGACVIRLDHADAGTTIVPDRRVVTKKVAVVALLVGLFDAVTAVFYARARLPRYGAREVFFELARRRAP